MKESLLKNGSWKGKLDRTTKGGKPVAVESHMELLQTGGRRTVLKSSCERNGT